MAKDDLKEALRRLLRDVLEARFKGGNYGKLARAHGYADGYMRAMLDAGIVEQGELLKLVCTERQRFVEEAPRAVVAAH